MVSPTQRFRRIKSGNKHERCLLSIESKYFDFFKGRKIWRKAMKKYTAGTHSLLASHSIEYIFLHLNNSGKSYLTKPGYPSDTDESIFHFPMLCPEQPPT